MNASLKIEKLEAKISGLKSQYQLLLHGRQKELAELISKLNLTHIDNKTLMGGFLFLQSKITTQDPIVEDWHNTGARFLRQSRSVKKSDSSVSKNKPTSKNA
ncbi:MAG: conjugal transfer protein TraD [Alphaproteobacteria bacterium]|jgi:hypothetical protein|nr:conjugal transfer protein TraD [Alphaproteobacteria bacterium]MBT5389125.1 conjugal transfer protein TraD [Alphaproteobacteria bacterium]MBT5654328.1 conjugal transfer protein TraD [Alphaproteobacteria bacterium]